MSRKIGVLVAAVGLLVAFLVSPAAKAFHPGRPPAVDPVASYHPDLVAAMARDLKLTPDQARERLARERKAAETEQVLRAGLGQSFAGAWIVDGVLTVAVTDAAKAEQVRTLGAVPRVVTRSLVELEAQKYRLDQARPPKGVPGWYVDVATNQLVVLVAKGAYGAAREFARSQGVAAGTVRFVTSAEQPRPLIDIIGGNAYYFGQGRCSIGFAVTGGFVTAGHCGRQGTTTTQPSGQVAGSSFPGNDYGWVRAAAGNTPRPLVNRYPGTVPVAGSTEAAVGSSVCRSGSTTGWRCGTILQKNTSVTYPEGTITGLTRTNACAEPGDSGGSWLTGDQAQGVTSGGSGNCTSGGTIYFQPVNEILSAYQLTLTVSGGNPPSTPPTTPPGGTTWQAGTTYAAGATVTYGGQQFVCLQGHTAQTGWEPPNVPALWRAA